MIYFALKVGHPARTLSEEMPTPVKRMCACGTAFSFQQSHNRHARKCAVSKACVEQGDVFELGVWHGYIDIDSVLVRASLRDAFYRVLLHIMCNGELPHNRSVRVAAAGGWRVRRRRSGAPTQWFWEHVQEPDGVRAMVDEVTEVVMQALDDVVDTPARTDGLADKARAAQASAQRPDHAERVLRVLRELRVGDYSIKRTIARDAEEREEMRQSLAAPPVSSATPPPPPPQRRTSKQYAVAAFVLERFPDYEWVLNRAICKRISRRRPDMHVRLPHCVLIIEVDEHAHRAYDPLDEGLRGAQLRMCSRGGLPIVMVRFNPDAYKDRHGTAHASPWSDAWNIADQAAWEARLRVLERAVALKLEQQAAPPHEDVYLFYDGFDGDQAPQDDLAADQLVDQISTGLARGIVFATEAFGKLWATIVAP